MGGGGLDREPEWDEVARVEESLMWTEEAERDWRKVEAERRKCRRVEKQGGSAEEVEKNCEAEPRWSGGRGEPRL